MNKPAESLADKAYRLLEELIVTLQLPPGTAFSETELSMKIDIGRTPLREALQRLAAARLVSTLPRRGVIINEINITELLTLIETRRILDRLLASRAARRASAAQRQQLQTLAEQIVASASHQELSEFMRRDREFDQILAAAAKNAYAAQATLPLHSHCRRFWYSYQENGDLTKSAGLHAAVMRAVAEKDEEKSAAASDELIDYLEEFVRDALNLY